MNTPVHPKNRQAQTDLAGAWESGYWHGTSHTGPLNDAAIKAKNPYLKGTDDE